MKASLAFGPSSSMVGFASKAVSSDNDANPRVVVRELIQNALDAAEQRGETTARVEFRLRDIQTRDLPGIEEFRTAFEASCKTQGDSIAAAAHSQVEGIRRALEADTLRLLEVRDNGVGLDRGRMNALLGEGRTDKTGSAGSRSAGSYGLGHFTTFAVTNLQYVLYGGVNAAGATTMSAHAVLASHLGDDDELHEPHGYFIQGRDPTDVNNWFVFPQNEEVPQFVAEPLDEVQRHHGSGSVILIPAFNDFREEAAGDFDKLADLILEATAQNFYPAVRHEQLEVSVMQGEQSRKSLRKSNLDEYLHGAASGRDAKRAHAGYRAIVEGREEELTTSNGSVRMYVRTAEPLERIQLSIFRNGMFIAAGSTLPIQLQPHRFGACKPFVGVLCFEPPATRGEEDDLYEMLRTSEGEKHLNVDAKRLPQKKRSVFHQCMRELQSKISEVAGPDDTDQFAPDFLLLNPILPGKGSNQPRNRQRQDNPESGGLSEVPAGLGNQPMHGGPVDPDGGGGSGGGDGPGGGDKGLPRPDEPRLDRNLPPRRIRPVLRALGASRIKVVVVPEDDIPNAKLRLALHSGADPSCDAGLPYAYAAFSMEGGTVVTREVPLGTLNAGVRRTFELDLHDGIDAREAVFMPAVVSVPEDNPETSEDPARKDDGGEPAANREDHDVPA